VELRDIFASFTKYNRMPTVGNDGQFSPWPDRGLMRNAYPAAIFFRWRTRHRPFQKFVEDFPDEIFVE
jgi:hypothetical protein